MTVGNAPDLSVGGALSEVQNSNPDPTDRSEDRIDTRSAQKLHLRIMADALGMLRVLSKEGKDVGKVLPLREQEVLIGRCETNHR